MQFSLCTVEINPVRFSVCFMPIGSQTKSCYYNKQSRRRREKIFSEIFGHFTIVIRKNAVNYVAKIAKVTYHIYHTIRIVHHYFYKSLVYRNILVRSCRCKHLVLVYRRLEGKRFHNPCTPHFRRILVLMVLKFMYILFCSVVRIYYFLLWSDTVLISIILLGIAWNSEDEDAFPVDQWHFQFYKTTFFLRCITLNEQLLIEEL